MRYTPPTIAGCQDASPRGIPVSSSIADLCRQAVSASHVGARRNGSTDRPRGTSARRSAPTGLAFNDSRCESSLTTAAEHQSVRAAVRSTSPSWCSIMLMTMVLNIGDESQPRRCPVSPRLHRAGGCISGWSARGSLRGSRCCAATAITPRLTGPEVARTTPPERGH